MLEFEFISLGICVFLSYGFFTPLLPEALWDEVFNGRRLGVLYRVTILLGTLGFVIFSFSLFNHFPSALHPLIVPPYMGFLVSAAFHVPLASLSLPQPLHCTLACTCLCACLLAHYSVTLFGWKGGLMVVLALHCTVVEWAVGDWRSRAFQLAQEVRESRARELAQELQEDDLEDPEAQHDGRGRADEIAHRWEDHGPDVRGVLAQQGGPRDVGGVRDV